jgi:hypothetical protein
MKKADIINARIAKIFGTKTPPEVTEETLLQFRQYILDHFDRETILTGRESFRGEENYSFGPGDDEEHEKLNKTQPSHTDTFRLVDILPDIFDDYSWRDLLVKVRRLSDRKQFYIELSNLQVMEYDLKEFQLLEDYVTWKANDEDCDV